MGHLPGLLQLQLPDDRLTYVVEMPQVLLHSAPSAGMLLLQFRSVFTMPKEVFSVVRPEMSKEMERMVREMVRRLATE